MLGVVVSFSFKSSSWLLRDRKMKLRTTYPGFIQAVESFLDKLIPKVASLQVKRNITLNSDHDFLRRLFIFNYLYVFLKFRKGGPVIAVQLEQDYGSYASDSKYMPFLKKVQ